MPTAACEIYISGTANDPTLRALATFPGVDPKRLRCESEATRPSEFRWDYVETGPQQWQVRITRAHLAVA